jgi:hypothetical protein
MPATCKFHPVRLWSLLLALAGTSAWAQDPYEIQVYAADLLEPGTSGLEVHLNHARASSTDFASHLTLEPHLGIAPWLEVGMYFTSVLKADGRFDFSGVKARVKVGLPERLAGMVGLALNTELNFGGGIPEEGMGLEFRPIVDLDLPLFYFALNPILTVAFDGPVLGFEPAVKANVKLGPVVQLGLEYYGGLELAPEVSPLAQEAHRLFGVVDLEWKVGRVAFSLDVGAGYGITGAEKFFLKTIFGVDFT